MNKLLTNDTKVGGFPLVLDDIRWFTGQLKAPNQQGVYQAFNNLLRGFGDNFIVQGCVEGGSPGAVTLTEGWILLAGELLKVDAQAAFNEAADNTFVKVTTFDSRGNKTFQNGAIEDVYEINRGNISGSGGTLAYNADTLAILTGQTAWIEAELVAGDFTSQAGTWTIVSETIHSRIVGKTMTVNINISASTIGAATTDWVKITVPEGKTTFHTMFSVGQLIDANGQFPCRLRITGNNIEVTRLDGVDIAIGGLQVFGQITFDII